MPLLIFPVYEQGYLKQTVLNNPPSTQQPELSLLKTPLMPIILSNDAIANHQNTNS